jgi:hypothetical protein
MVTSERLQKMQRKTRPPGDPSASTSSTDRFEQWRKMSAADPFRFSFSFDASESCWGRDELDAQPFI